MEASAILALPHPAHRGFGRFPFVKKRSLFIFSPDLASFAIARVATSIRPLNRCMRSFTASILLLTALALRCSCMPLPWPSEHSPNPFTPPFWVHLERVCTHIGQPSSTCTSALIHASASQHPVSMLAASAAWRHALGDVYGKRPRAPQCACSPAQKQRGLIAVGREH